MHIAQKWLISQTSVVCSQVCYLVVLIFIHSFLPVLTLTFALYLHSKILAVLYLKYMLWFKFFFCLKIIFKPV